MHPAFYEILRTQDFLKNKKAQTYQINNFEFRKKATKKSFSNIAC